MARIRLRTLVMAVTGLMALGSVAASAAAPDAHKSPAPAAANNDLICHTDVAAECYPRVFEPTNEFQPIHADQDIPAGLHVRLNINTGEREAKLYNKSDDVPPELEGLAVERSVVVVDPADPAEAEADAGVPVPPKGAPAYDPVGAIKDPAASGADRAKALNFFQSLDLFKGIASDTAFAADELPQIIASLDLVEELAHDIFYGLQVVEDAAATRQLLCLAGGSTSTEVAQKAAAIVGSAVQNNPKALAKVAEQWDAYKATVCGDAPAALGHSVFSLYEPFTASPAWARSRLSAINGLIRSEPIMEDFLASGGLTEVLRLLVQEGKEGQEATDTAAHDNVRRRAAHLISDSFLDESMNARVDLWPKQSGTCAKDGSQLSASCWRHEIEKQSTAHRKDTSHWSHELWTMMQAHAAGRSREEL